MTVPKDDETAQRRRIVRYHQLATEFGIDWSRMHLDRLILGGKFPQKIRFGENSIGWFSDEIEAYIAARAVIPAPPLPNNLPKAWAATAKAKQRAADRDQPGG